jgi:hypothetical protein
MDAEVAAPDVVVHECPTRSHFASLDVQVNTSRGTRRSAGPNRQQ